MEIGMFFLNWKRWYSFPNNPFTSAIHLSSTLVPMPCSTWAWLVNAWTWKYSVERLPADTQHQIKSFTVESKEFTLSLHKHESNGDGGLHWMWARSDIPWWFLHTNCVVVYPPAFAVRFKFYFKPSKITVMFIIPHTNLSRIYSIVAILFAKNLTTLFLITLPNFTGRLSLANLKIDSEKRIYFPVGQGVKEEER